MTSKERFARARELFARACDLPADERHAFLDQACGTDRELREELDALLSYDAADTCIVDEAAEGCVADELAAEMVAGDEGGDCIRQLAAAPIGGYQILRRIGRGGMGEVFEAWQENPRRRVALKMVRPGLARGQLIRRLQREAQVLGRLQHPGIAQVYEGGFADVGHARQPYFAMEFIAGLPLNEFAAGRGLCSRSRLELVARVCDAVHYAHEQGVIHRDLKPGNILVAPGHDGGPGSVNVTALACGTAPPCQAHLQCAGQPKVLDFGVARLMDADVQLATLQTDVGQLVGTLSYMSPEQVNHRSAELDRRCDIYALGVVLHELLTGKLPLDISDRTIPEAARVICDEEPSRLGSIDSLYRGDIEIIVAKALEKEPVRRYQTAAEMAADIRRYLADRPIVARPVSAFYQMRKFARRNKGMVAGLATAFVALLAGLVGVTFLALREADARRSAQQHAIESDQTAYRAGLAAAAAALDAKDVASAERHLLAAPVKWRGWEWEHLYSRLDESVASVDLSVDRSRLRHREYMRGRLSVWVDDDDRVAHAIWHQPGQGTLGVGSWELPTLALKSQRQLASTGKAAPTFSGREILVQLLDGRAELHDVGTGAVTAPGLHLLDDGAALDIKSGFPTNSLSEPWAFARARTSEGGPFSFVAFARDGQRMLGVHEHYAAVFRPFESAPDIVLEPQVESLGGAAFSGDGRYLATGGNNRRLALYDLTDGGRRIWERRDAHDDAIIAVTLSPDGQLLATGGQDRILRLWDAHTGASRGELMGHREPILAIAFRPNGRQLVSCSAVRLNLWDLAVSSDLNVLRGHTWIVRALAITPDGSLLASGAHGVRLWDVPTGLLVGAWQPLGDGWTINRLSFSCDGRRLAVNGQRGAQAMPVRVLVDMLTGEVIRQFGNPGKGRGVDLAFTTPGTYLIHGDDRRPCIVNAETFDPVGTLGPSGEYLLCDGHGEQVATVDVQNRVVRVFGLPSGALVHQWHRPFSTALGFLYDGRVLAVGSGDRGITLLDIASGRETGTMRGHTETVRSLRELTGQGRLASGADDRTVRIWNPDALQEVVELRGHLDTVWDFAVTPDGRTLFSGSGDYTVRRWDTRPLAEILAARREYQRIADTLTPRINALLSAGENAASVADLLNADASLTEREHQIAGQLVLRRVLANASAGE